MCLCVCTCMNNRLLFEHTFLLLCTHVNFMPIPPILFHFYIETCCLSLCYFCRFYFVDNYFFFNFVNFYHSHSISYNEYSLPFK